MESEIESVLRFKLSHIEKKEKYREDQGSWRTSFPKCGSEEKPPALYSWEPGGGFRQQSVYLVVSRTFLGKNQTVKQFSDTSPKYTMDYGC